MRLTPQDLWCIQTRNNTDSFDVNVEEMFTEEAEAERRKDELVATRHGGRADYLVRNVAEALAEARHAAELNAMSEG